MAGQKRPQNNIHPAAAFLANTPITVPAATTSPRATSTTSTVSTATAATFDVLNHLRVNNLGSGGKEESLFAGIDKSSGFYDLAFKSISVSGDLELTSTPTNVMIGLKRDSTMLNLIQSGVNLTGEGGRIYRGVNNNKLEFRSIRVGPNLTLTQHSDSVVIGLDFDPPTGDITGAESLGGSAGQSVFHSKDGTTLLFRKLVSDNNVISLSTDVGGEQIILSFNESQLNLGRIGGLLPASKVTNLHQIATSGEYMALNNRPLIPTRLTQLDVVGTPSNGHSLRYNGTAWESTAQAEGVGFSTIRTPDSTLVATSNNGEFSLLAGAGMAMTTNTMQRTVTYSLAPSGVTAGLYTNASITVDTFGRITGVSSGDAPGTSNFVDPTTAKGDLIFRSNNVPARLAIGNENQVLTVINGVPVWRTPIVASGGTGTVTSIAVVGKFGISAEGGPISTNGTITLGLTKTGVLAGTYVAATITVDAYGRITSIANNSSVGPGGGSGGEAGVIRTINTNNGIVGGGPLTGNLTLGLSKTGVTGGTFTNPRITIDEYGRVLSISSGTSGPGGAGGGVTSINATGSNGITVSGGPVTSSGTLAISLGDTGVQQGEYGVAKYRLNAQGRVTQVSATGEIPLNGTIISRSGEPIIDPTGGIYLSAYAEAQLMNKNHAVNTSHKDIGKLVINLSNYRFMVASGDLPTDVWLYEGGASGITPV